MFSLKVKLSLPDSLLEYSGLVKFGRFSGEELALSSRWNILDAKNNVYERMELVAYMGTYARRKMRPNTLSTKFHFSYFSLTILLHLNNEMQRFTYSGISR